MNEKEKENWHAKLPLISGVDFFKIHLTGLPCLNFCNKKTLFNINVKQNANASLIYLHYFEHGAFDNLRVKELNFKKLFFYMKIFFMENNNLKILRELC